MMLWFGLGTGIGGMIGGCMLLRTNEFDPLGIISVVAGWAAFLVCGLLLVSQ